MGRFSDGMVGSSPPGLRCPPYFVATHDDLCAPVGEMGYHLVTNPARAKENDMTRGTWLCAAACASFVGGCSHEVYDVDMSVEGNVVVRSINVRIDTGRWVQVHPASGPASEPATQPAASQQHQTPKDLDPIAAIYKVAPATSQPWKRGFVGRTPDDVGGAGQVEQFPSELGSAWIYLERFRGDSDPAGTLQERLRSADILASVIAGWARARLGDRKDFDKLGAYLDGEFRKDARNLSLVLWTVGATRHLSDPQGPAGASPPEDKPGSVLTSAQKYLAAVAIQYLVERRYLALEDAPAVIGLLGGAPNEEQSGLLKHLWRKFLTDKIGLTDEALIDHLVGILDWGKETAESLETYVRSSKEYKEHAPRLARLYKEGPTTEPSGPKDKPPGLEFMTTLAALAFTPLGIDPFCTSDELRLTLASKDAPVLTNGTWDEKAGAIRWNGRLGPRNGYGVDPLPAMCYAVWARPDERSQTRHFGRVILREGAMASYCLWRKALTPDGARQWGAFVATLKPETAAAQLASFRSAREKATTAPSEKDKLAEGAGMVADALREPPAGTTMPATDGAGRK
jgi:hypothetical protein